MVELIEKKVRTRHCTRLLCERIWRSSAEVFNSLLLLLEYHALEPRTFPYTRNKKGTFGHFENSKEFTVAGEKTLYYNSRFVGGRPTMQSQEYLD